MVLSRQRHVYGTERGGGGGWVRQGEASSYKRDDTGSATRMVVSATEFDGRESDVYIIYLDEQWGGYIETRSFEALTSC